MKYKNVLAGSLPARHPEGFSQLDKLKYKKILGKTVLGELEYTMRLSREDIVAESTPAELIGLAQTGDDAALWELSGKSELAPTMTVLNDRTQAQLAEISERTRNNPQAQEGVIAAAQRYVSSKLEDY